MKKVIVLEEVEKEAKLLREHATWEERQRLDFANLNGAGTTDCIYGQMTGNCFSRRAAELLKKCAIPVDTYLKQEEPLNNLVSKTPDSWDGLIREGDIYPHRVSRTYFSAIEIFAVNATVNQARNLIDYLKGDIANLYI